VTVLDAASSVAQETFELDTVPLDARAHVNKKVRISGRLAAGPATATALTETDGNGVNDGRNRNVNSVGGAVSSAHAPSATFPRRDEKGTSRATARAAATARQDVDHRRLRVETIRVLSQTCAP
jgi:hypothetical protein